MTTPLPRPLHRTLIVAVVLTAMVLVVLRVRSLLALETAWWKGSAVDPWTPLGFSLYASFLAGFLAWKAADGPGARTAAFALAFSALWLSLIVVPDGGPPSTLHAVAYAFSWLAIFWFLQFIMVFPREITVEDLGTLDGGGPWAAPRRGVRRLQRALVAHPSLVWWPGLLALAALARAMTGPAVSEGYLMPPTRMTDPLHLSVALLVLLVMGLGTAFLRTGYRRADEEGRRRIRWLVLSWVALFFWSAFGVALAALTLSVDLSALRPVTYPFWVAYYPVAWFLLLSGIALAVFHSGAFDVRPLITRTTVYGSLVVALTFVFVGVEEVAEAQLARLGMGDGAGVWLGAGIIALAMGPLKARLEKAVAGMGDAAGAAERSLDLAAAAAVGGSAPSQGEAPASRGNLTVAS